MTAVRSLIRSATRQSGATCRFATFLSDKYYDEALGDTPHEFYFWDRKKTPEPLLFPANFHPITTDDLPIYLDIDAVICNQNGNQYRLCRQIADFWHLPLIRIFNECRAENEPMFPADLNIYSSYEIQFTWNYPGAVVVPGVDPNFTKVETNKNSDIILCDIKTEQDILYCKEVVKNTGLKINSMADNRFDRLEQYKNARALIQIKPRGYPVEAFEAMAMGLPILTVGNSNLKSWVGDYNNGMMFNTVGQLKSYMLSIDKIAYKKQDIPTSTSFIESFNQAVSFIDNFIYIRN